MSALKHSAPTQGPFPPRVPNMCNRNQCINQSRKAVLTICYFWMLHADRIYVFGSHDIETQQICDGIGCLMYSGLQQNAYRRLCVALRSTLRSCFIWSWVRSAPNMQGGSLRCEPTRLRDANCSLVSIVVVAVLQMMLRRSLGPPALWCTFVFLMRFKQKRSSPGCRSLCFNDLLKSCLRGKFQHKGAHSRGRRYVKRGNTQQPSLSIAQEIRFVF